MPDSAASLDNPEAKLIVDENSAAQYANGYIFFIKDGKIVEWYDYTISIDRA